MEIIVALAIGILTGSGLYLLLREQTFSVVLGLTLLSYAVNLVLFASGRLVVNTPPLLLAGIERHTDPLPQALVLTAIVISFGMTAYLIALALRAKGESGSDRIDADGDPT
ncbi:MAG: Na+/H+ antiporter subunit C [Methylacidiphilales bacterium]|nr:Na+/H+ antiporter subunit C [Candidatus Methylacidiphilales bacterium]